MSFASSSNVGLYIHPRNGNVGIGTGMPLNALHVRANTTGMGVVLDQVGAGGVLDVRKSGVSQVVVDGNGNVGIGTTLPITLLHMRANTTNAGVVIDQAGTGGILDVRDGGVSKVVVDANGNVGIGMNTPSAKLQIQTNLDDSTRYLLSINDNNVANTGGTAILFRGIGNDRLFNIWNVWSGISFSANNNSGNELERMRIAANGYVGIGNTNPQFPLHVIGSVTQSAISGYYFNYGNPTSAFTNLGGWPVCIKAHDYIWSTYGFIASSDTRIKTNIQDINDETALSQLRLLQPKTYEYIDKVQRGSDPVIGFIAQEVAEVLPRAVTKQKEIIPTVYAIASVSDGVLQLEKEHGLVVGDKIKLIKEEGGELITNIKAVLSPSSFTVEDPIESTMTRIFVYGKEVPDFHTLDKNAIFTIGVAAVQELDRQVQQLKADHAALLQRIIALEKASS